MNEGFTLVLDWQQAETVSKLPLGTKQKLAAGLAPKGGDSRGIKHPVEVEGLVSIEIGTETVTVFAATVLPGSTSTLPNGLVVGISWSVLNAFSHIWSRRPSRLMPASVRPKPIKQNPE